MKSKLLVILRYTVLAGILAFAAWYVSSHYSRFAANARFTWRNVSLLGALCLLTMLAESMRMRFLVRRLGYPLNIGGAWHLMTLMQAVNHMVLKAGTFSGGFYMSRRFGISLHSYIAFVITYVVVMTLGSGVFGLAVTIVYIVFRIGTVDPLVPVFFLVVILGTTGFIALASVRLPLGRLPRLLRTLISAWQEIYGDTRFMATMTSVELVYFLFCSLRFMVAVSMFGSFPGFLDSVVVVTVGNFLRVASIVPGGLGIAELASGWTAGLLGGDTGLAGLAAGLDRLVYVAIVMLSGGIGFLTLSGKNEFHKPPAEEIERETGLPL